MIPSAAVLMLLSGCASLGYQMVWTPQCAVWLGHETAAVLAVVAAFFGGLALGAGLLGARIERSARPARWYAGCEALIAAWSLVLAGLMNPLGHALLRLIGPDPSAAWQWLASFAGTFLLLLPATAAMGATLPAMSCTLDALRGAGEPHANRDIAMLYACNTAGAVFGVLLAALWLVPALGLLHTALLCALCNLLCAAIAWRLPLRSEPRSPQRTAAAPARDHLLRLFATGFLGIGFEVLVVRVLSQLTEDTVYTFALLLAVYLAGTALGAEAYRRWRARQGSDDAGIRQRLLVLLALSCLAGALLLWPAAAIKAWLIGAFGAGMTKALLVEAALAVLAFALPTFAMGAVFSHLAEEAHAAGIGLGRALACNTAGAALAPGVFGVLLVPALGFKPALLAVVAAYLLLAGRVSLRSWRTLACAGALAGLAVGLPRLSFVEVPEGGHIVRYRDGATASVSVVADAENVLRLRIDNRQQEGSSNSVLADSRQALLPILLQGNARRVLFLGLGTGVTAMAAAANRDLQVDVAELLPEVIEAAGEFAQALDAEDAARRLHIIHADARRYVRAADDEYEVIIADNFHPARSGSGALYTAEHFSAVRERLAADGLFCQWLPLHQLDLASLRSIVRAFLAAFPDARAIIATNSLDTPVIGLIGTRLPMYFEAAKLHGALLAAHWPQPLADFALPDEWALLGSFIAGPQALARFAQGAALNSDDHPVVSYSAPRITYAPDSLPRDRLAEVLQAVSTQPAEVLPASADDATRARLAAYWAARNRYIEIGRTVQITPDAERMLAQVRTPLLEVLHTSPDFRPAYDPLLALGRALAAGKPQQARELLSALVQLQPARNEARQLLAEIRAN